MIDTGDILPIGTLLVAVLFLVCGCVGVWHIVKGPRNPRNSRQWRAYAASAMHGLASNPHVPGSNVVDIADTAAKMADAMMVEGGKRE